MFQTATRPLHPAQCDSLCHMICTTAIRYVGCSLAIVLGLTFSAVSEASPPSDPPLTYSYKTGMTFDDDVQVLQVHHGRRLSVAKLHPTGEAGFYADGDQPFDWAQSYTWVTGAMTDDRLARYQNVGKKILQIREIEALEPGVVREPSSRRGSPWMVEDLAVSLQPGERDMTVAGVRASHYVVEVSYEKITNPGKDNESRTDVQATRHFWFDAERPFSPLQTLPLQLDKRLFVAFEESAIQEGIYLALRERMQELGMLVRMEYTGRDGEPRAFAVDSIEQARPLDLSSLDDVLVFTDSQADAIAGPMFMSEMIRDSMDKQGAARFEMPVDADSIEVEGSSGFSVMESGDFAIAMTFTAGADDDGIRGMLLLMRPHHGQPDSGNHTTARNLGRGVLTTMTAAEIENHARGFQALGVVRDGNAFHVLTEAVGGEIQLTRSDTERVSGDYRLEITTMHDGRTETREISGSFDAPAGDIGQFNHPASRLIDNKRTQ